MLTFPQEFSVHCPEGRSRAGSPDSFVVSRSPRLVGQQGPKRSPHPPRAGGIMGEADRTQAQKKKQVIPQCMGQERHEGPGPNLSGDTLMRAQGRSWCQDHSLPCLPDHRALALPTLPPAQPRGQAGRCHTCGHPTRPCPTRTHEGDHLEALRSEGK